MALIRLWMLFQRRQWNRSADNADAPRESSYEPEKPPPKWTPPGRLESLDFVEPESFLAILVVAGAISIVFVIWYCISLIVLAPEFCPIRRDQGSVPLDALLFFVFLGVISQILAPDATSMGGVIRDLTRH